MIKMIVVDLDGTILTEQRIVSYSTKQYLKKLKDNGYVIVIATGRIYSSILNVTDGAEFANYIISDNGVCTYKAKDNNPIFTNVISKETVKKFLNYYGETVIL